MAARRLTVTAAAKADIGRLGEDAPTLERRALALIDLVEAGRLSGQALADMRSYGDLSDCRKVYFARSRDEPPTHRLVYQITGVDDSGVEEIEVVEIVAVEAREEGYVYLLASHRLGRLPEETKPRSKRVHETAIKRRGAQRKSRGESGTRGKPAKPS